MCGILATTDYAGFGDEPWKRGMQSIASRGPDDTGQEFVDGMAFGHTRLSIIGHGAEGHQPVVSQPDHLLLYNGEIYNYRELADEFGVRARSDTTVLYEVARRGWKDVNRLRGMYAFVHYDRHTRRLTAGRDPFGIKPLYVLHHPSGELSFGSTAAALARHPDAKEIDAVALTGFLAMGLFSGGRTPYFHIEKLAPGVLHHWSLDEGRWRPQPPRRWTPDSWPATALREALADSVRAHLVADVPVGVLLSGGIDSTLLAAQVAQRTEDLRTFSLTNPTNPTIDEGPIAAHNAALLGSRHVEVPVTPLDLRHEVRPLLLSSGEPFSDAAYLPLSVLTRRAAEDVRVAIAGEGADELFGGYRRYDVEALMQTRALGTVAHHAARAAKLDRSLAGQGGQLPRSLAAAAHRKAADRHAVLMFSAWDLTNECFPETGRAAHDMYLARWAMATGDPWAFGRAANQAYDAREWLPNVLLEKSDRASMAHGLEIRVPYLDPVIARAASSLPWRGSGKKPQRVELESALPGVALPRRKKGLGVDLDGGLNQAFTTEIHDALHDRESVLYRCGLTSARALDQRQQTSSSLAFRIAVLRLWEEEWL